MFDQENQTVEQKFISDFTGQLAKKYDYLYFLQNMKDEGFAWEPWKVVAREGYLGMLAPEQYGGTGYKVAELVMLLSGMAKKGLASLLLMNQFACCDILEKDGSGDQKEKHLKPLIEGTPYTYAFLEDPRGLSLFDISMTAKKDGEGYKLNGTKCYVVGAKDAKYILVAANTDQGPGLFLVDADAPGLTATPREVSVRVTLDKEMTLITGDRFYDLAFKDVIVPAQNLIGQPEKAQEIISRTSGLMMIMMASLCIGWGERVLESAVEYAKERVIFEEPIGSYQAIQHPMVRAKTELELAKLAVARAANAHDQEEDKDEIVLYSGIAKYAASEAAFKACDISLQAHGGYGFDRETGIITFWPLILLSRIIPLNNDIILEHFAEEALDLPA